MCELDLVLSLKQLEYFGLCGEVIVSGVLVVLVLCEYWFEVECWQLLSLVGLVGEVLIGLFIVDLLFVCLEDYFSVVELLLQVKIVVQIYVFVCVLVEVGVGLVLVDFFIVFGVDLYSIVICLLSLVFLVIFYVIICVDEILLYIFVLLLWMFVCQVEECLWVVQMQYLLFGLLLEILDVVLVYVLCIYCFGFQFGWFMLQFWVG